MGMSACISDNTAMLPWWIWWQNFLTGSKSAAHRKLLKVYRGTNCKFRQECEIIVHIYLDDQRSMKNMLPLIWSSGNKIFYQRTSPFELNLREQARHCCSHFTEKEAESWRGRVTQLGHSEIKPRPQVFWVLVICSFQHILRKPMFTNDERKLPGLCSMIAQKKEKAGGRKKAP